MNPTDEIKNRLDIIDVISETVELKRSGRSYTGFCPFHQNTRTPSFVVFPESQTWRCFGACAEGGDLFAFVMKKNGWDFREALTHLADRAGVQLETTTPERQAEKEVESGMADLLEAAADYFHHLLLYAPQAEGARQYLAKRQLTEETIATFKLGYGLDAWHAGRDHFLSQGYTEQELLAVGLLTENIDKGTRYDRFRDRLMFPIWDLHGRVVGFGARTLAPDGIPKYLNSPQTPLFDKSHLLYGLEKARRHVRDARQVVIVEGYMDVIRAWQHGYRNVVAQMGTALTEEQLRQLKRYTKRFIIALDADAAGIKATMRSLEVARQTLDRQEDVQFNAAGLVQYEGRLQADIRVVSLPAGDDPDSIIQRDAAAWPPLIAQAKPVVEYVMGVLVADLDLNDAKGKTAVAQQIIPLIQDIQDPVERDHYWQLLSRLLRTDIRALRQLSPPATGRRTIDDHGRVTTPHHTHTPPPPDSNPNDRNKTATRRPQVGQATRQRETNLLHHYVNNRDLLAAINHRLIQCGEAWLNKADFTAIEDQTLFEWLRQLPVDQALTAEQLPAHLRPRFTQLQQLPRSFDFPTNTEPLILKLTLSLLDWRREKMVRLNQELQLLVRELQEQLPRDEELIQNCTTENMELTLKIRRINRAKGTLSGNQRRR